MLALSLVLFIETLAALPRRPAVAEDHGERQRLAVLVPAHNEEAQIAQTLRAVRTQLGVSDRLVVVADNCTDLTAQMAASEGAEVIARADAERRGKGYALDFGVRHLALDPPDVVVIVDADCDVTAGTLDRLVRLCSRTGRPVQSLYLMGVADGSGFGARFAQFAWVVKNQVRPSGLYRLGLPCQLMGTGMAFPWAKIRGSALASSNLVEDMKLGIDLARAGSPPLFSPDTLVHSTFPASSQGVRGQRTRWEHGHLLTILQEAPRAFIQGVTTLNLPLAAMALDLAVPPLALLGLTTLLLWGTAVPLAMLAGAAVPLAIASIALGLLGISTLLAWWRFGRAILSTGDLLLAPLYMLRKLPLYAGFLVSRQMEWVRSKRNGEQ
jgi:cellulose synthase/poly-beta-1,6-N-acetylglucosamine synthase-like glycosyltransferase